MRLLPANPVLQRLIEPFENAVWSTSHGQDVVRLPREELRKFGEAAREAGFELLADVTAVDWLDRRDAAFRCRRQPAFDAASCSGSG